MADRIQERSNRYDSIDLLKILACLLITNSHCREIYPWYFLAVGGGFGNGLFFLISGYLLAQLKPPFLIWIRRRLGRIIPTTMLFILVSIMFVDGPKQILAMRLVEVVLKYVDQYWFVAAIGVYYFFFYPLFLRQDRRIAAGALAVYGVGYVLLYLFVVDKTVFSVEQAGFCPIKVYFYFGLFLMGGILRLYEEPIQQFVSKRARTVRGWTAAASVCFAVLWAVVYGMMMVFQCGYSIQFLVQLSVFGVSLSLFLFAFAFYDLCLQEGRVKRFIRLMANSTLEIYLVQVTIQPYILRLRFPWSWLAFFATAIAGGMAVHVAVEKQAARRKKYEGM